MITARHDGVVRTHEEALACLRGAVPGAIVEAYDVRPGPGCDRSRGFVVTLERVGRRAVSPADTYALPCPESNLARRARELAQAALVAAEV